MMADDQSLARVQDCQFVQFSGKFPKAVSQEENQTSRVGDVILGLLPPRPTNSVIHVD